MQKSWGNLLFLYFFTFPKKADVKKPPPLKLKMIRTPLGTKNDQKTPLGSEVDFRKPNFFAPRFARRIFSLVISFSCCAGHFYFGAFFSKIFIFLVNLKFFFAFGENNQKTPQEQKIIRNPPRNCFFGDPPRIFTSDLSLEM